MTNFADAFKNRLQESGKSCSSFNTQAFFTPTPATALIPRSTVTSKGPPRLVSDQMVNIFFQEWAPLFPILHRPTFLTLYADYVANAADFKDRQSLAQLHLVFGIAALSAEVTFRDQLDVWGLMSTSGTNKTSPHSRISGKLHWMP